MMKPTPVLTLLGALFILLITSAEATKEPKTGISFAQKYKGSSLDAVGVRAVGPLKIYALGKYDSTFLLKMNMGVSAEKIASSTAKAVRPRCSDKSAVQAFEDCLVGGLPNGCSKGTSLAFSTSGGKLGIAVNDKNIGSISSKPLAKAFAAIYTDKNAVLALKPVGEDGEGEESGIGGLITPSRCAIVAAALGWGIAKLVQ